MRQIILISFCFLIFSSTNAQENNLTNETPFAYFNSFQKYSHEGNTDSALYFIQKLASNDEYIFLLKNLIHQSFAQAFIQRETEVDSRIISYKILSKNILIKMASDTTRLLLETIQPMHLWVKIQDNKDDATALTTLTNEFIKTELSEDIYNNSAGRYGLMIYQIIAKHNELAPLANSLFNTIYSILENNQIKATDSSSRFESGKRAWYRYLFAYANYIKAGQADNTKEKYLKNAFDYSPDLLDRNNQAAYSYDMFFLFNGKEKPSFKPDYLEFLTKTSSDKKKIRDMLLEIALIDIEYKNKLEEFYNNNNTTSTSFNQYWRNAINTSARKAPQFSLGLLDGNTFSKKKYLGKWILLDFWGTWCGPCRAEHPELQKFYESVVLKNSKNISLLTIACRDTREKVGAYLKEKQFTFPVAISDGKIESIYPVQGYPTKILITPEGKYLTVPFGINWVQFVRQYCNL